MREFIDRIQGLWCEAMHERAMWPIHGKYRCATCLREYAVGFEGEAGFSVPKAPFSIRRMEDRYEGA